MTKSVRIENADTSSYKVRVRVYEKGVGGEEDQLISEKVLDYPTALEQTYITSTRYIIIDEI